MLYVFERLFKSDISMNFLLFYFEFLFDAELMWCLILGQAYMDSIVGGTNRTFVEL